MNKLIKVLFFSLILGFTGSTYSADSKPASPQKECTLQAEFNHKIALARDSVPPVQLAEVMWEMYEKGKISAIQLAAALASIIDIYSSPMTAQDIRDQVYSACMASTGKDEV